MIELVASPGKFDGETVLVEGAFSFDDEGDLLCLSKEAARYHVSRNCLSVTFDLEALETTRDVLLKFHGKYAFVVGGFGAEKKGIYGMAAGGIRRITFVAEAPGEYAGTEGGETAKAPEER